MFCNIGLKVVNRCWFSGWNVFCGWLGGFDIGPMLASMSSYFSSKR